MSKRIDYHPDFYVNRYYHVYNRAVGHDKLFYNDENYKYFLKRYSYYLHNHVKAYSFCLLPNHFHLLISSIHDSSEIIIEQFRKFFISYSMSINLQLKRKGNLFQSNFKRKIIDDEKYLLQAVYYIHANPVHHKIEMDLEKYKFSSYKIVIADKKTELQRNDVLDWFSGRKSFINFHRDYKSADHADDYLIEDE
ncbi:MAG: transposase [bacterium]